MFCSKLRLYIFESRTELAFLRAHLEGVTFLPYSQVIADLKELVTTSEGKIWISKKSSRALVEHVPRLQLCSLISPIQLLKGIKNDTEIQGMRTCQVIFFSVCC